MAAEHSGSTVVDRPLELLKCCSFHPVRQNLQRLIELPGIIRGQVHAKIVLTAHVAVHHERHREGSLLTGIEGHRTDDRCRRSTPLDGFDVGPLCEAQRLIADVSHLELNLDCLP